MFTLSYTEILSAGVFEKAIQHRSGCCTFLVKCLKEKWFKDFICLLTIRSGSCDSPVHFSEHCDLHS